MTQRESQSIHATSGAVSIDLLAAAMVGLLGLSACSSDATNPDQGGRPDAAVGTSLDASTSGTADGGFACPSGWTCEPGTGAPSDAGAPTDAAAPDGSINILLDAGASFTLAQFQALCDARGGFFYTNAACAGGAACKGLSFHDGDLWEHSCRGQNSECAGANCVDTPPDTGLTGQQVYEQGPCSGCHGSFDATTNKVDPSWYAVYYYTQDPNQIGPQYAPATAPDYATALAQYQASPVEAIQSKIAFGVSGTFPNGTAYNNMPMYYQTYSAAEMKRAAQYVHTLQAVDGGPGLKTFGYGYPEYPYLTLPDASTDASGD